MIALRTQLNLDNEWLLALDPEDCGVREAWYDAFPQEQAMTVNVPGVWDIWIPDYDGVGWYYRTFEAPDTVSGAHVELQFSGVNYFAEVWLNGIHVGAHEGGYTPFALDVTAAIAAGANRLAVRVVDPKGPEGFGIFKPLELPIAKEMGYWSSGGIWGNVQLSVMPKSHITDVFVQPDLRRKRIAVQVAAAHLPETALIHLAVEGTPYACAGKPGLMLLPMSQFETWSPDSPHLYRLRADIRDGDHVLDSVTTRFGMREFTVKDNRFHLNFRPVFLRGVLYQPDYARSLVAPESDAIARREIEYAKAAGFNMIRVHIKPAPKIFLELADELGILLYEEPSIGWIKDSEYMRARCEASVREMILRDRNHPSVVIWGMLNESGNAEYVTHGGAQNIKEDLCRLARSLDPTRVIIDDSAGVNATREPSRLMRPWRDIFEEYDDLHIYQRAPVDRRIRDYYMNSGEPDRLAIISEFGFGGPEDLDDVLDQYGEDRNHLKDARFLQRMLDACNQGFVERGLDKLFGSFSDFARATQEIQCDAARFQIEAMRANPKLAGYCYTQLSDAGHEFCAGILDRWRRPKPVVKTLAEVQSALRPLIMLEKTNLWVRESIRVSILLANANNYDGTAELSLQVVGPTNQVLWKKKRSIKLPRNRQELWAGEISASGSPGAHRIVVRLMQDMKILTEASCDFHVFEPATPSGVEVHVLDPHHPAAPAISRLAKQGNILAPIHIIPPVANTIGAYPDNELMQVLAQAKGGAIAIFFGPPGDLNELAALLDDNIRATPKDAVGGFLPVVHYVKLHPVFDKLPARGLMRQPYHNIIPPKTFLEISDEDICGAFDATPVAAGNYMTGETAWWGSDILVKRYGAGRLVMTHMRILEHLDNDPMAEYVFVNMLNHFARRSVPPAAPLPPDQKAVEWLRTQRTHTTRRWMIAGEFPNWGGRGFDTQYPPEQAVNFDAVYEGWYQPARWRRWFSRTSDAHVVDLQTALEPVFQWYPKFDRSVAYAYAEMTCDKRIETEMYVGIQNDMRVWINGVVVFETRQQVPHDRFEHDSVPVVLRQGKNTVLVKCAKIPGPFKFSLEFAAVQTAPQSIKWWK